MTAHEAKQILLAWRPGCGLERDPEMAQALECAQRDPALAQWLEEQRSFHRKMKDSLRDVPIPVGLSERILHQANRHHVVRHDIHRVLAHHCAHHAVAELRK
jgi:hypothetical protein